MKSAILISLLLLSMCKSPETKTPSTQKARLTYIDTSRYAILNFNPKEYTGIFDKNDKATTLTADDIYQVEKIIADTVKKYNKWSTGVSSFINKPEKYYKQFITVINQKGEKEVWVNCFCYAYLKNNRHDDSYWRNGIVSVMDGGTCFFQLKVNLTKDTLEYFNVNGSA